MGRLVGKKELQQEWEEKKGRRSNDWQVLYICIYMIILHTKLCPDFYLSCIIFITHC